MGVILSDCARERLALWLPTRALRLAPIAQLDRALPSEGRGQRFESSWVRHFSLRSNIALSL